MKKQDYILVGIVALFLIGSFFLTGKKDDKVLYNILAH